MFKGPIKIVLASLVVAAGATFSLPAAAEWPGNVETQIRIGHSGIYIGNGGYHQPHYGHRSYKKRHYSPVRHRGVCNPRKALRKAWHMGVNRPHIARVNHKKIVVKGFNYGHRAKVVFKRSSHKCRVIKTRGLY